MSTRRNRWGPSLLDRVMFLPVSFDDVQRQRGLRNRGTLYKPCERPGRREGETGYAGQGELGSTSWGGTPDCSGLPDTAAVGVDHATGALEGYCDEPSRLPLLQSGRVWPAQYVLRRGSQRAAPFRGRPGSNPVLLDAADVLPGTGPCGASCRGWTVDAAADGRRKGPRCMDG